MPSWILLSAFKLVKRYFHVLNLVADGSITGQCKNDVMNQHQDTAGEVEEVARFS